MKWIFIALLIAGLISCKDDDSENPIIDDDGNITVGLGENDFLENFESKVRAETAILCFPGNMSMIADYYNVAGERRATIDIYNIPFEVGTYKIHRIEGPNQACSSDTIYADFATIVSDGDALGDFYLPLEDAENQVTITSHNSSAQEVAGTFDLALVIIEEHRIDKTVTQVPDTVRFTNGRFRARYTIN